MAAPDGRGVLKKQGKWPTSPLGVIVRPYVGDIMSALADAIVTPEDRTMSHPSHVTKELIKEDILFELERKALKETKVTFPLWTVCATRWKAKVVYHAFLAGCAADDSKQWIINMKKLYANLFREADKKGSLVIAMPLIGAGLSNVEEAIGVLVNAIAAYKPKTVTDIEIISTDPAIIDQITEQCWFEFKGRLQKAVTFKDEDESSASPRRSKSRLRGLRGRGRGKKNVKMRLESRSSSESNDSSGYGTGPQNHKDSSPVRSGKATVRHHLDDASEFDLESRAKAIIDSYDLIDSGESSEDERKYKTFRKMRKKRSERNESKGSTVIDDKDVVRPSMKGNTVSANGKTYDVDQKYEGSPLLKSARDVREKVIGPPKEVQPELPKKDVKPVINPKSPKLTPRSHHTHIPRLIIPPARTPLPNKILTTRTIPKLNLTQSDSFSQRKEDALDSSRRTKSSELVRTRKRSQSLAAEEHQVLLQTQITPSITVNGETVKSSDWSGGPSNQIHSYTPAANALSNQNMSIWSSDDEDSDDKDKIPSMDCPICLRVLRDPKTLDKCGHTFCSVCIDDSFANYKPECPSCNMVYGVMTGNQPEGNMDVTLIDDRLPGYSKYDTIVVTYTFPDGIQGPEHPDPSKAYKGTTRKAYLPNSTKGMAVLRLLRTAFKRRLIFTIVRSATSDEDSVVWNDIHHKTSMTGGPTRFGYPDREYLRRVREELSSKGVTD